MNAMLMAALTYAAAIILLTQGFVLTYKTTRTPNFILGYMMPIGGYAASLALDILCLPMITAYPVSFITGCALSVIISVIVIEPLVERQRSPVMLTLVTMALGLVMEGTLGIYNKYTQNLYQNYFARIFLKQHDIKIGGLPGVFVIATILTLISIPISRYVRTRTKIGLTLRSYTENQELAQVQGVNTKRSRILIWSLAGGLSSLAGGILAMWFHVTWASGSWVNTGILAAAILGGMDSFRGAFIGGLLVGVSEIIGVTWGQYTIGVWVGEYRAFIPFIILCVTLLFAPNGLMGSDVEEYRTRSSQWARVRKRTLMAVLIWLVLSGALVANISNRNKSDASEAAMEELSFFDLEEREMNKSIPEFRIGNFTTFMNTVERLNITEIYIEPGTLTVYYIRHNAYWTLNIRLQRVGLWNWTHK